MSQYIFLSVLFIFMQGCASFQWVVSDTEVARQNKQRLAQLSVGMPKSEVLQVMGTQTQKVRTAHYRYGNLWEFPLDDLEIRNPCRVDILKDKEGKTYEIIYYYSTVRTLDGIIADNELTPLVFENERLIGWGDRFLEELTRSKALEPETSSIELTV